MAGNRKAAEEFILKYIGKILPTSENVAYYTEKFASMSDAQFDTMMDNIENHGFVLPLIAPNLSKDKLDTSRNIKIGEELGHTFFERLKLTDDASGVTYTTPLPYMIVDLPIRRQVQTLSKKMAVPENNNVRDELTDQATGPSKGSGLSFPETQVLVALGMDDLIEELIKVRGGDEAAFNKMNKDIIQTGESSLSDIRLLGTRAKATDTLSAILKGMHLDNNL